MAGTLLDPVSIPRPGVGGDPGVTAQAVAIRDPRPNALAGMADEITKLSGVFQALHEKKQDADDNGFLDAFQLEYTKRSSQAETELLNSPAVNQPDFVNVVDKTLADIAAKTKDDILKTGAWRPSPKGLERADHAIMSSRVSSAQNAVTQGNNQRVAGLLDAADTNVNEIARLAAGNGDLDGALARVDGYANSLSGVLAPSKLKAWKDKASQTVLNNTVRGLLEREEVDKAQALVDRYTGFAGKQTSFGGKAVIDAAKSAGVDPAVALGIAHAYSGKPAEKTGTAPDQFMAGPKPAGLFLKGNIDIYGRPVVKGADGKIATVRSISIEEDGKTILIPTVSSDGRVMTDAEAIEVFRATGAQLGVFNDEASANAYAKTLSEQQEALYTPDGVRLRAEATGPQKPKPPVADAAHTILASTDQDKRVVNAQGYGERITGKITVNGNTYTWASGGRGRGSLPFGSYSVVDFMTGAQRQAAGYQFTKDSFMLSDASDPLIPGQAPRTGLLIHAATDGLSAGCVAIDGDFKQFQIDMMAEAQKRGGLGAISFQVGGGGSKGPAGGKSFGFSAGVAATIDAAAQRHGIAPETARLIVAMESGGDPSQVNELGYSGLTQLLPGEFKARGGKNILDAAENADIGFAIVKEKMDRFEKEFGRPPSATELYLMHQQGEAGLRAHAANPDQLAWQSMRSTGEGNEKGDRWAKAAICGNIPGIGPKGAKFDACMVGQVNEVTSAQFTAMWAKKLGDSEAVGEVYTGEGPSPAKIAVNTRLMQTALGTMPTPAEIYLSTIIGTNGVIELARANPDTNAHDLLTPEMMAAHPEFDGMNAEQLMAWAGKKMQASMEATAGDLAGRTVYAGASSIPVEDAVTLNREINTARTKQKADYTSLLDDDVRSIRETGKPVNIDVDKARTILTPQQFQGWQEERQDAAAFHEATADMNAISDNEIADRIEAAQPMPGTVGYDRAAKLADEIEKEAKKVRDLRASDPVASISGVPAVQKAASEFDPKQPQKSWRTLIDARVAAQNQVGIDALRANVLTKEEAKRLATPLLTTKDDQEWYRRFEEIGATVTNTYGDYADEVMTQLVVQYVDDKEYARFASGVISNILAKQKNGLLSAAAGAKQVVDTFMETSRQTAAMPAPLTPLTRPQEIASGIEMSPGKPNPFLGDPHLRSWSERFFADPLHKAPIPRLTPSDNALKLLRSQPDTIGYFMELYGPEGVPEDMQSKIKGAKPPRSVVMQPVPAM